MIRFPCPTWLLFHGLDATAQESSLHDGLWQAGKDLKLSNIGKTRAGIDCLTMPPYHAIVLLFNIFQTPVKREKEESHPR